MILCDRVGRSGCAHGPIVRLGARNTRIAIPARTGLRPAGSCARVQDRPRRLSRRRSPSKPFLGPRRPSKHLHNKAVRSNW